MAKSEDNIKEKVEKTKKSREAREKAEADTAERSRAWAESKAREKSEIARICSKARDKVDPEYEATERSKEKPIASKRVVEEVGAETRVRLGSKAEFRVLEKLNNLIFLSMTMTS